jgi:hypothetical protein
VHVERPFQCNPFSSDIYIWKSKFFSLSFWNLVWNTWQEHHWHLDVILFFDGFTNSLNSFATQLRLHILVIPRLQRYFRFL